MQERMKRQMKKWRAGGGRETAGHRNRVIEIDTDLILCAARRIFGLLALFARFFGSLNMHICVRVCKYIHI